jgi:hypothetical protein
MWAGRDQWRRIMVATQQAIEFFLTHGGWGYDPQTETAEEGRVRSAREMAEAEAWMVEQPGFTVEWFPDTDYNPADYDAEMPDTAWGCTVTCGEKQESLWGITFDGDGHPAGNPYARVVVAELAHEMMP